MGKKAPSTAPSSGLASPSAEAPRMDAPPPYDQVFAGRRSSSISMHSFDRMNPRNTDGTRPETPEASTEVHAATSGAAATTPSADQRLSSRDIKRRAHQDGGCLNFGQNVDGCMNVGGGWDVGKTSGCMNIGGGQTFRKTDGCMNYQSSDGCMNYQSSGGCLNYQVHDDWEGNEGCLNFKRGGGVLLRA